MVTIIRDSYSDLPADAPFYPHLLLERKEQVSRHWSICNRELAFFFHNVIIRLLWKFVVTFAYSDICTFARLSSSLKIGPVAIMILALLLCVILSSIVRACIKLSNPAWIEFRYTSHIPCLSSALYQIFELISLSRLSISKFTMVNAMPFAFVFVPLKIQYTTKY